MQTLPCFQAPEENQMIVIDCNAVPWCCDSLACPTIRGDPGRLGRMNQIPSHPLEHVVTGTEQKITMAHAIGFYPDQLRCLERISAKLLHTFVNPLSARMRHDRQCGTPERDAGLLCFNRPETVGLPILEVDPREN